MLAALTRGTFSALAGSVLLKKAAARYGMRQSDSFARRFVAGQRAEDAIAAVQAIEAQRLAATIDLLGESVTSMETALAAARAYADLIRAAASAGISRNISVKLTQIGLDIDRATAIDNLRRVLDPAVEHGFFVRIDMEASRCTDDTLEAVDSLWGIGYRNMGVAIQAALRRSTADVRRLNETGVSIRLVKGAYREPRAVAFTRKDEVDAHFVTIMEMLLDEGHRPAIATHDPAMIDRTKRFAAERCLSRDRFEFQLLYGIRRDLQISLAREGYPVRVYVPYGREWFPYFMRRLGERPANVAFVLKNLLRETPVD